MKTNKYYQEVIERICKEIQPFAHEGKQADYIPALANVNPDQFGIYLSLMNGEHCTVWRL